jgi:hypothetical protein
MSDDPSTAVESEWLAPPDQPAEAGGRPATAEAPSGHGRWLRAGALVVAGLVLGGGVALSAATGSAASGDHHDPAATAPATVGDGVIPPDDGRLAPDGDEADEAESRYSSWRTVASDPGKNSPS